MNPDLIVKKFGDVYTANLQTYTMGIDQRFTTHFASRFKGLNVLETCTGGGFTTISLARTANHVITVEIDRAIQRQAISNVEKAGRHPRVTFILGDVLDQKRLGRMTSVDAALIDPDWAATGPDHVYRFRDSNTRPPADLLLKKILDITENVALVLPPLTDVREFDGIPEHERERLYLGNRHELFCLYFGVLIQTPGDTEFHVHDAPGR